MQARYGDLHRAEHALMEARRGAMAAQRAGRPPMKGTIWLPRADISRPPAGISPSLISARSSWKGVRRKC